MLRSTCKVTKLQLMERQVRDFLSFMSTGLVVRFASCRNFECNNLFIHAGGQTVFLVCASLAVLVDSFFNN
jgi:hypothetical protein